MLSTRLQNARGVGPPKWEPRSHIGIYLRLLPFHAGSVALVWNPTTGRVSPQYHVVFDEKFKTAPYMEAGTILLNWDDLVKYSSEMATAKYVNLADTWLNVPPGIVGVKDQLSDTFTVVTDHRKLQKTNTTGTSPPKPNLISDSKGDNYPHYQAEQLIETAANFFAAPVSTLSSAHPSSDRAGVYTNTFGKSKPTLDKKLHDVDKESLKMPII